MQSQPPIANSYLRIGENLGGTATVNVDEGGAILGQYAPKQQGYTRAAMATTMGIAISKEGANPEK